MTRQRGAGRAPLTRLALAALSAVAPGARLLTAAATLTEPLSADMLDPRGGAPGRYLALDDAAVAGVMGTAADRDAEIRALAETAGADVRCRRGGGARRGAELPGALPQRYPEKGADGRFAEVLALRYDTGEVVRCKVDLATNAVEVLETGPEFPVPVAPAEIAEAATVARADERVRARMRVGRPRPGHGTGERPVDRHRRSRLAVRRPPLPAAVLR